MVNIVENMVNANTYYASHQPINTKINQFRREINTYCTEYGTEAAHDAIASGRTIIEAENEKTEAENSLSQELLYNFYPGIYPECFNNLFIAYFWLRLPDEVKNYIHLNANKLNYIFMLSMLCAHPVGNNLVGNNLVGNNLVGNNTPVVHTLDIPMNIFNLIPHYSTYSNNLYISPSNEISIRSVSNFNISYRTLNYFYFLGQKDEDEDDFENYCELIIAIEHYNEYDRKNYDKGFLDLISQL